MQITAKVNTAPVATYYSQLAAATRQSLPRAIRFEAAATVRRAMQFVGSTQASQVKEQAILKGVASFRESEDGFGGTTSVSKRSKQRGRQWMVGRRNGGVAPMGVWNNTLGPLQDHTGTGWRVPVADWIRFKALWAKDTKKTKDYIKARLGARGITARSWFEILQALNSEQAASVPAFIQRARPISGKMRHVGFAMELGAGSATPQVTITNTSGLAVATGGERKLQSAITIRRKFFMDSLQKGFFTDAKFIARNYPWAKVT